MTFPQNQNSPNAEAVRQQVREAVQSAVQAAQEAKNAGKGTPQAPTAPQAPVVIGPVPKGGGRLTIQENGNKTTITTEALPPELMPIAGMIQETAISLMAILAVIVIGGPFARMLARRMERRGELASGVNNGQTQQQLLQLQQSVDAMALEVERISEAQRFQTKLLNEGRNSQG